MSTFDFTIAPQLVTVELISNTALSPSPFTGGAQTLARDGQRWMVTHTWNAVRGDVRAEIMAFLASLNGQEHRVRLFDPDNPKRGSYGGTPVVDGAGQSGDTLAIRGCTASVTNWIRKGDYFAVIVNGEPELKMSIADTNTDGTGHANLSFRPKLRTSPIDGAAIRVDDGVLTRPSGVFVLAEPTVGWSSRPGNPSRVSSIVAQFVEDIFFTL